jgi:septal ring factor EnvC (AmiA/AmiB activator)
MSKPSVNVDDEWFSIDLESKMNRKIDTLQTLVHEQMKMIQTLSEEIKVLKGELHSTHHQSSTQNNRTHELLEELKVIKQRELNFMLREKIPVPFVQTQQNPPYSIPLSQPLFPKKPIL